MPNQNNVLTDLRLRRGLLYAQLNLIDKRVADAQRSPLFGTAAGNSDMSRNAIEGVEGQIKVVDRQIAELQGSDF